MNRYFLGLIPWAISLCLVGLFIPCWAGDRMNVDFLTRQALKKNLQLKKWDSHMVEELYGNASLLGHSLLMADILSDGLWGTSMGISSFKTNLITGITASALDLASSTASGLQERHSKKKMRKFVEQIKKHNAKLEGDIKALYADLQNGSSVARTQLVELTSEEDVDEVEANIAMHSYFKTRWDQLDQPGVLLKTRALTPQQITQKQQGN